MAFMGIVSSARCPFSGSFAARKSNVTGYCIRFKSLRDVDLGVLEEIIAEAMDAGPAGAPA
jgi:hypothetical protein